MILWQTVWSTQNSCSFWMFYCPTVMLKRNYIELYKWMQLTILRTCYTLLPGTHYHPNTSYDCMVSKFIT